MSLRSDGTMMQTLYDKIWQQHVVCEKSDGTTVLYIDRHLIHEVTSPQAFEGLECAGRKIHRPETMVAVCDHNVPTTAREQKIADEEAKLQIETLLENCHKNGIPCFDLNDKRQGIVHVIGPEQGLTLPGTTLVCGDSHTATHGAFGALAFGIGTSEVEHVMATQTLVLKKSKNMRVTVKGKLGTGVTAKDLILAIIAHIGTAGATGHVIEYVGETIRALSMEARMTVCNMSIEAGARAGLIAPDATTFAYLKDRPFAPKGVLWEQALAVWQSLQADDRAHYDSEVMIDAAAIAPHVTWGTSPENALPINAVVPNPAAENDPVKRQAMARALDYMGLEPGTPLQTITIDKVFIGSCTNARIEDLRAAAQIFQGRKVATHVQAIVVPGSGLIKAQAEAEGLDKIFSAAGAQWREPGCSMCIAMNADKLAAGERCASTSNRNFEGRQGRGGRTHLMSPAMAAAAAIRGRLTDVREM